MFVLAGCGYSQPGASTGYQWKSLYRENIQSGAVPIFTSKDYHRGVEFSLTKAVVNQMEAHTPYKVVSRDRADTILEGEISDVKIHTISNGIHNAIPQEQLVSVSVNFTWKDLHTGKILVQRRDFEQTAAYYPTLGEGQFQGDQLNVEKLALAIVQQLEADW
jgi:hypothetical protein